MVSNMKITLLIVSIFLYLNKNNIINIVGSVKITTSINLKNTMNKKNEINYIYCVIAYFCYAIFIVLFFNFRNNLTFSFIKLCIIVILTLVLNMLFQKKIKAFLSVLIY